MQWLQIAVLAVIQGLAELLPVSSSAHVIAAEKLMGLDPSAPAMTFLLVMLHTGTMFAVIGYFWSRWRGRFGFEAILPLLLATGATGVIGFALKELIEKVCLRGAPKQEIEALFSNLPLIAAALAAAGLLILVAGRVQDSAQDGGRMPVPHALWIGLVQGLCLPFRGFSRSGATISTALLCGESRALAEDFSFALAVILTPAVIAREAHRLMKAGEVVTAALFLPGLMGMALSFLAGLAALRWLSAWLEKGRWSYFGWYCLAASAGMLAIARLA